MVVDRQGLPVPGARITLTQRQGSLRKSILSSTEEFQFDGLVAAVYDMRVEAAGFAPQSMPVDLLNDSVPILVLNVELELEHIGQEVVVTATRTEQRLGDVPVSMSVLNG